jgi:hypothetical protein
MIAMEGSKMGTRVLCSLLATPLGVILCGPLLFAVAFNCPEDRVVRAAIVCAIASFQVAYCIFVAEERLMRGKKWLQFGLGELIAAILVLFAFIVLVTHGFPIDGLGMVVNAVVGLIHFIFTLMFVRCLREVRAISKVRRHHVSPHY